MPRCFARANHKSGPCLLDIWYCRHETCLPLSESPTFDAQLSTAASFTIAWDNDFVGGNGYSMVLLGELAFLTGHAL